MFWNRGVRKLLVAENPPSPRTAEWWPLVEILDTSTVTTAIKQEGMAAFDVDGDGLTDLVEGIYCFKYQGGNKFKATQIANHPGQVAAGAFKPGKVAQLLLSPSDPDGPVLFIECKGDPADPKSWVSRDLLVKKMIRGHTLALADTNADGNLDIFTAKMGKWSERNL